MKNVIYAGRAFSPHVVSAYSEPYWQDEEDNRLVKYIRADLYTQSQRELEEANKKIAEYVEAMALSVEDAGNFMRDFTEVRQERDRYRDLLQLVLPMAKGYAAKNDVGSNWHKCMLAHEALHPPTNPIAPGSEVDGGGG